MVTSKDFITISTTDDLFNGASEQETKPRQVFGEFLYEGELGVLFGDSNTGKSILANDIAFFAGGGGHSWDHFESPNMPVLYIDMEMSRQQFVNRYIGGKEVIPSTYRRAEIDMTKVDADSVMAAIKIQIIRMQGEENAPKFIIIDNITSGFGSIQSGKKMREFVCDLKTLKDRFGLTILLIAHTIKRNPKKPITADNLGGSKMLMNFVDSAFAICPSFLSRTHDKIKYIKQIKTRVGEKLSGVMGVVLTNKAGFPTFIGMGLLPEEVHLCGDSLRILDWMDYVTPELEPKIIEMVDNGTSYEVIAETLDIPQLAVLYYVMDVIYQ